MKHIQPLLVLPLVALATLMSCQSALRVVVTPEIADLAPLIKSAYGGLEVAVEDPNKAEDNVLRITTSPGWNVPTGSASNSVLPATVELARAWPLPASLTSLGRSEAGWTAIPLLYDLWGVTQFVTSATPSTTNPLDGKSLFSDPSGLKIAGGSPAFRQAVILLSNSIPGAAPREALSWFRQPREPWSAAFEGLPALLSDRRWEPDAWSFSRSDLEGAYRAGSVDRFVETYQQFATANPPGTRQFSPLVNRSGDQPAYIGRVVFVEYRGSNPEQAVKTLVEVLGSPFVKRAGQLNKWLAASLSAPEVDGTAASLRQLVSRPSSVLPVTDRLPEMDDDAEFLSALQLKIETTSKR